MQAWSIDSDRLLQRIRTLGQIGRDDHGALTRLAGSEEDRLGRDQVGAWMRDAGLILSIDRVGNMFGTLPAHDGATDAPLMIGSHIDTVINAGIYDGCYGVLAGIEIAQRLREISATLMRPLTIAAFTNEEGVRFQPDMLGSLAHAGGISAQHALAATDRDGVSLADALRRIGYDGPAAVGAIKPAYYLELHIEQGPVLEQSSVQIGAVENLQGISWRRVTIEGEANHAGTTPMRLRRDAGVAAARIVTFLRDYVGASNAPTVATVGSMAFEPSAINVIPARAILTVDLRDPDAERLRAAEMALDAYVDRLARDETVAISVETLARFEPVVFDDALAQRIEAAAQARRLSVQRMTSGAGHDAQMIARMAPAAMIFVPSKGGVSHNPAEFTADADLIAGANVLLDVARDLIVAR